MSDYFYTWSRQDQATGIPITGGEGVHFDVEGEGRWLDLGSLSYQANLGHQHPQLIAAIAKQASELCMAPPNAEFPAKSEVAAELLRLAPDGFSKVFFTLGGAEANENAMKIARMASGRLKFLSRYRSYHGATMGALALTGDFRRPPIEPVFGNVVHFLGDNIEYLEEVLALEGAENIAAIFMEPIPGANGVLIPPKGYWKRMRELCDEHGIYLVADEVLTGFGRTGKCFGFEHEDVVPDIISLAKGLSGGAAPLGAVLVHDKIAAKFADSFLYAGLTNYAHPLGCAAAAAALQVYRDDGLYTRGEELHASLMSPLIGLSQGCPEVKNPRGRGLLAAVDLPGSDSFWSKLQEELSARRIFVHASPRRKTLIVSPPLIIEETQLQAGMNSLCEGIAAAAGA